MQAVDPADRREMGTGNALSGKTFLPVIGGVHAIDSSMASRHTYSDHHPDRPLLMNRRQAHDPHMEPDKGNVMQTAPAATPYADPRVGGTEPMRSAVSWGAVLAGAAIAAALSAMLITGGTGLGFLAVSPWQSEGASGSAIAAGTIVWLLFTQVVAYGVAGYVAGRLRTRWTDAAVDEIFFRDTAHGFLVWAVSALIALALLGS